MKRIKVSVIPNSRKNEVVVDSEFIKIHVTAQPQKGAANKAIIELIANHFNIRKSSIRIISGTKSRKKIVEIKD